jgi:hypothetical protein
VTETDTIAELVRRIAAQLDRHLPGAVMSYSGYATTPPPDLGTERLAAIAPLLVALSEATKNLAAARALAPETTVESPK